MLGGTLTSAFGWRAVISCHSRMTVRARTAQESVFSDRRVGVGIVQPGFQRSRSPRRSADDSGTVESEEADGTADRAPQRSWARGGRSASAADCLSRQRLRRSSRLTSRNLGEPVDNRPFTLRLGSTRVENRSRRRSGETIFIAFRGLKAQVYSCGNRPVRQATS